MHKPAPFAVQTLDFSCTLCVFHATLLHEHRCDARIVSGNISKATALLQRSSSPDRAAMAASDVVTLLYAMTYGVIAYALPGEDHAA